MTATNTLIERDRDTTGGGMLNERLYYQIDADNSVTAVVNTSATVVERYIYTPFGTVQILTTSWANRSSSTVAQNIGFQSGRNDQFIADVHFDWREFRPSIEVWVSQDREGFAAGYSNFYVGMGNNPVNRTDPTGLFVNTAGDGDAAATMLQNWINSTAKDALDFPGGQRPLAQVWVGKDGYLNYSPETLKLIQRILNEAKGLNGDFRQILQAAISKDKHRTIKAGAGGKLLFSPVVWKVLGLNVCNLDKPANEQWVPVVREGQAAIRAGAFGDQAGFWGNAALAGFEGGASLLLAWKVAFPLLYSAEGWLPAAGASTPIIIRGGANGPSEPLVLVSRWGGALQPGTQNWVMPGNVTYWNYFLSAKWQLGMGNRFAWPSSGQPYYVAQSHLQNPDSFMKYIWLQKLYNMPPNAGP